MAVVHHHFQALCIEQARLVASLPAVTPMVAVRQPVNAHPVPASRCRRAAGRGRPRLASGRQPEWRRDWVGLHPGERVGQRMMLVPLAQAIDQLIELMGGDGIQPTVGSSSNSSAARRAVPGARPSRWRIPRNRSSPGDPPRWPSRPDPATPPPVGAAPRTGEMGEGFPPVSCG